MPPSLSDFLDESHPAHAINDIVERLDLSRLENRYGHMGQPAYHPRLMLKVTLYGFTVGVFSSRKLQRACQENLAFKYLAGMETPAFKTFIEFRRRHRDDMKAVFGQIQVGMGFRRFFYRGSRNVGSEWNLVCAALNVKKMAALMRKSGV